MTRKINSSRKTLLGSSAILGQLPRRGAFSLVEMLMVISILLILMALVVPASKGLMGTTGRKGAVNSLLGTFDQARVAALESGTTVYILLWRREFPEKDAYLVMRKGIESDIAAPATVPPNFVYLTGWKALPKGIIFYEPTSATGQSTSVLSNGLPSGINETDIASFPMQPSKNSLSFIEFNESGVIRYPSQGTQLALYIAEGTRGSAENLTHTQGTLAYSDNNTTYELQGGLEKLVFARYTGRAKLEIATFN